MNYNLAQPFHERARLDPDGLALHVSGVSYTYGELDNLAGRAAFWLSQNPVQTVGILAARSLGAYAGLLSACWCGAAYVPLNPKLPGERLARIFEIVALDVLIVDTTGLVCLTPELRAVAPQRILYFSDRLDSLPIEALTEPVHCDEDTLAYIMFTSGTSGVPKGVMITLGNVAQFLNAIYPRFSPSAADRVSQTSELTFDVSVFEMFSAWGAGASVHVIPATQLMAPAQFIVAQQLTVWSSVPSIAAFMRRMKMLRPGVFPSLRYSVFAGEALPFTLAEAWQAAAPSSVVENLYGPTEATVYCVGSTFGPDLPPTPGRGIVPSGMPLPGLEAAILDESLKDLPPGREGELAITGPQLAKGYYGEPELTMRRFPTIGGKVWYLTGDLAYQDDRGVFHHLGRIDHQVKVLGQRVELEEVEAHLRVVSGSENVAAVGWPIQDGVVAGIVAFVSESKHRSEAMREALRRLLPHYMVPHRIIELDSLPLSANGKIDRRALAQRLDDPGGIMR